MKLEVEALIHEVHQEEQKRIEESKKVLKAKIRAKISCHSDVIHKVNMETKLERFKQSNSY
jgi:hypothetical protein